MGVSVRCRHRGRRAVTPTLCASFVGTEACRRGMHACKPTSDISARCVAFLVGALRVGLPVPTGVCVVCVVRVPLLVLVSRSTVRRCHVEARRPRAIPSQLRHAPDPPGETPSRLQIVTTHAANTYHQDVAEEGGVPVESGAHPWRVVVHLFLVPLVVPLLFFCRRWCTRVRPPARPPVRACTGAAAEASRAAHARDDRTQGTTTRTHRQRHRHE